MAGVKGRSGGARSGAGRPRKSPEVEQKAPALIEAESMLDMLQKVALGKVEATPLQVRAAIAAVQYTHVKAGEGGKKDARKDAATAAAQGRLAPRQPPKLVVNNG